MAEKRSPQKTPGRAEVEFPEGDDFTLPGSLYYDAVYFCHMAEIAEGKENLREKERYARAAIYCDGLLDCGWYGRHLFRHAQAHSDMLGQIERDVLEECETTIDAQGNILRK